MSFLSVLLALFIFGVLIFIHELGHFLVARALGVKILEFSIGMGPKLLSKTSQKSGTKYSLRLIPIGGYVSMYGENGMEPVQGSQQVEHSQPKDGEPLFVNDLSDVSSPKSTEENNQNQSVDPELEKQAYCNKSVWIRILISLAGPFMNILLGFVLMMVLVISSGPKAMATTQVAGFFVEYQAESTYQGLQPGDQLYEIQSSTEFGETKYIRVLSIDILKKAVQDSENGTVTFSVIRLNEDKTKYIEPNPVLTVSLNNSFIDESFQASLSSQGNGLHIGDTILKVNQTSVHTYDQLSYEIMNQGYRPVTFTVRRNGEKIVLNNVTVPVETSQQIAFGNVDFLIYREQSFHIGTILKHTFFRSISTVKMVFDSIQGLFTHRYGVEAISGPIGITKTISDVAKSGQMLNLLYLVIVISINLGVMNLLPLPALDGGHLLLYLFEVIRRKPMKREVEGIINFVGLVLILILAVIIAVKDVISL